MPSANRAGVPEHGLADLAVHVLREKEGRRRLPQVLPKQRPALDKREPAHILVADLEEIEGVEARCSAARAAQERVEVRQTVGAVRDRLAVQDDPGDR